MLLLLALQDATVYMHSLWDFFMTNIVHAQMPHTQNNSLYAWHCRTLLGCQVRHPGDICTVHGFFFLMNTVRAHIPHLWNNSMKQ